MDQSATIREATIADRNVLAHIIRESFRDVAARFLLTPENCPKHPSNCTTSWIESDMARGVQYFIMAIDGYPIGCVGLESPNTDICYIERLSVLPEMRGKHHGISLVRHALECATLNGACSVSIGIIAEHTELKNWYKGLGFDEVQIKRFPHLPFQVCLMEYQT
ncbi:MAG: GNAT family N-acetyltransferase [Proteobacteria bacterium]|nr:GNAT family N-acetyltransferase [Pseudomonadota bacterium]